MYTYLVIKGWWYEGEEVVGVFSNEKKALDAALKTRDGSCDFIDIEKWTVNGGLVSRHSSYIRGGRCR